MNKVKNQVNCPCCGLAAAGYMTSNHTNESAVLTVSHQESIPACTARLLSLDIHIFENMTGAEHAKDA
jgi:hypothetical protein